MPAEALVAPRVPVRRVIVNLHQAQRELVADLAAIGPRYRAERLRALALIGLAVLSGGIGTGRESAPALPADSSPAPDPHWQRRLRLLQRVAPDE